jgi:O-antigen/teichoic acid export membrane protein
MSRLSIVKKLRSFKKENLDIIIHTSWSYLFKAGSIFINFSIVPISISYLGKENYGVWLVISSMLSWFLLLDIGLGSGLRNKLANAIALDEHKKAQEYVSTAYFTITIIAVAFIAFMLTTYSFIDWSQVFNAPRDISQSLLLLMPILFVFFGLQLIFKLIVSVYLANQAHSFQTKVEFFGQACILFSILLLTKLENSSFLYFGIFYILSPLFTLFLFNLIGFSGKYKSYKPQISNFKTEHIGEITSLGFNFFIIQIGAAVLFTTDNLIVTHLYGPGEVVIYNLAFKYFSIINMIWGIMMIPLWSSVTYAYSKDNILWIKETIASISKIWLIVPLVTAILFFAADLFYRFWVGELIIIPITLNISMSFFVMSMTFAQIFSYFLNGVGKLKIQLFLAIFVILFNIPISIFLASYMGFGSAGVILGTFTCQIISCIVMVTQYNKIISRKAKGVWNN